MMSYNKGIEEKSESGVDKDSTPVYAWEKPPQ